MELERSHAATPVGSDRRRGRPLGFALAALLLALAASAPCGTRDAPGSSRKKARGTAAPVVPAPAPVEPASAPAPAAAPTRATTPAPSGSPGDPASTPSSGVELATRVNALVDQLLVNETRRPARAEIIAIGRDATPTLLTRFKDPEFTVRWEMANIQGDIRDERALPALVENVLADVDPHIRWRSIWALNEFPAIWDRDTIARLKEAMASDNWPTRWNAAIGLSMFRVQECLPVLEKGITDPDPWRRWEGISALGRIHDENSAKFLAPVLLDSTDDRERREAVLSLGRINTPQAIDLLIGALKDEDRGIRWRACMSLGLTGQVRALPHIEELTKTETDPEVLRHANNAITALTKRKR